MEYPKVMRLYTTRVNSRSRGRVRHFFSSSPTTDSLQDVSIPENLKEFYEFQLILLDPDMTSPENMNFILAFIKGNQEFALKQLEISTLIRPKFAKKYLQIIDSLPDELINKLLLTSALPHYVLAHLKETKNIPLFGPREEIGLFLQETRDRKGTHAISKEMTDALIDDNSDFFVQKCVNEITKDSKIFVEGTSKPLSPISAAALYGAVQCFKYFMLSDFEIKEETIQAAVAGGNFEIIRIIEQKNKSFKSTEIFALRYRNDEIFDWIINNNMSNEDELYFESDLFTLKALIKLSNTGKATFYEGQTIMILASQDLLPISVFHSTQEPAISYALTKSPELLKAYVDIENAQCILKYLIDRDDKQRIKLLVQSDNFISANVDSSILYDAMKLDDELYMLIKEKIVDIGQFACNVSLKSFEKMSSDDIFNILMHASGNYRDYLEKIPIIFDDLSDNQLFSLLQRSFNTVFEIISRDQSKDILKKILGCISIGICESIQKSENCHEILKAFSTNEEFASELSANEVYKIILMLPDDANAISIVATMLRKTGYIKEEYVIASYQQFASCVFGSEKFINSFDFYTAYNYLKYSPILIAYFEKISMSNAQFQILLQRVDMLQDANIFSIITNIIKKPEYRQYMDIVLDYEWCDALGDLIFSQDEIQLIKKKKRFSLLLKNPENKKCIRSGDLIDYFNIKTAIEELKTRKLTKFDYGSIFIHIKHRDFERRHMILSLENCTNYFELGFVLDNAIGDIHEDDITIKVVEELAAKKHPFNDQRDIIEKFYANNKDVLLESKKILLKHKDNFHPFIMHKVFGEEDERSFINEDGTVTITEFDELIEMLSFLIKSVKPENIRPNPKVLNDAFIYFAGKGELEQVKYLLDAGADVNYIDDFGDVALWAAMRQLHFRVINLLMTKKPKLAIGCSNAIDECRNIKDADIRQAMEMILGINIVDHVYDQWKFLEIEALADKENSKEPFNADKIRQFSTTRLIKFLPREKESQEIIVKEITKRPLNVSEYRAIDPSYLEKNIQCLTEIIKDASDESKVIFSACTGVDVLPEKFDAVDGALFVAVERGFESIYKKIFANGVSTSEIEKVVLHVILSDTSIEFVSYALENGFDPNTLFFYKEPETEESFETTLLNLCISHSEELFDLIMKYHPNTKRVALHSPFETAVRFNFSPIDKIKPLIDPTYQNDVDLLKVSKHFIHEKRVLTNDPDIRTVVPPDIISIFNEFEWEKVLIFSGRMMFDHVDDNDYYGSSNVLETAYNSPFYIDDIDEFAESEYGIFITNIDQVYDFKGVNVIIAYPGVAMSMCRSCFDRSKLDQVLFDFFKNGPEEEEEDTMNYYGF